MESTIEEAKQKWCPFARVGGVGAAVNRPYLMSDVKDKANCIGDTCMAWQWTGTKKQGGGDVTIEHSELVAAGVDPASLLQGREIALPAMEGRHQGLSLKTAKILSVWRDATTKVAYVALSVLGQGAEEKVGGCGLCLKSPVD